MCVIFIISSIYYDFIKVLLLLGLKRLKFCYVIIIVYLLFLRIKKKKWKFCCEVWNLKFKLIDINKG